MEFRVIDRRTRAEADKVVIARERWAGDQPSGPDEFVLTESGVLLLSFDDGAAVECPDDRFDVVVEGE